jgi:hypothetical protein
MARSKTVLSPNAATLELIGEHQPAVERVRVTAPSPCEAQISARTSSSDAARAARL